MQPVKSVVKKLNHRAFPQAVLLGGLVVIVCIVVAITHWPALSARALSLDDNFYLRESPLIANPSWSSARYIITEVLEPSTVGGAYAPVTMISQMLDFAMGGREDNLRPFHRTSLILHLANTALIIVIIYQLFGYTWLAAIAGLLFGIHPLTVGRVTWVTDRKTVLTAFFALSCLVFYIRYTHSRGWPAYGGCLLMYVLSLLSKPTSLPLPVVLLLLDYWPLQRCLEWRVIREKLPIFVVGVICFVIAYISFSRTTPIVTIGEPGLTRIPKILCHNIVFYLYKIFWPVNLSVFYPFPRPLSLSNPMVLAGIIGTCALIPVLLLSLRWTRALLTGWLIFFVAIFPTMGVIGFTDAIAANRFVYLPSIGFLLILSHAFSWLWRSGEAGSHLKLRRIAIFVVVAILAVLEIVSTRSYLVHWQDSESHQRYICKLAPNSAKIHDFVGVNLARRGKDEEAKFHFAEAVRLDADYHRPHVNLGIMLAKRGDLEGAIAHFVRAIQLKPTNDKAHHNLGQALFFKGNVPGAIKHYRESLRLKPSSPETLSGLSWVLAMSNEAEYRDGMEAVRLAKRACELTNYSDDKMLTTLAAAYAEVGNFTEAVKAAQKAIDLCLLTGEEKQAKDIVRLQKLYEAGQRYRANK